MRMLWRLGPLGILCKDHLVANKDALEEDEVWHLLRCIGFKPCACPEFILYADSDYDKWCFGNREGTSETNQEADEVKAEDDDDGDDAI